MNYYASGTRIPGYPAKGLASAVEPGIPESLAYCEGKWAPSNIERSAQHSKSPPSIQATMDSEWAPKKGGP